MPFDDIASVPVKRGSRLARLFLMPPTKQFTVYREFSGDNRLSAIEQNHLPDHKQTYRKVLGVLDDFVGRFADQHFQYKSENPSEDSEELPIDKLVKQLLKE